MTIERYLAELERRLPNTRRRRILAEAEAHLRDAAAAAERDGAPPEEAERRACESFGPVELVARGFAAESAIPATRRATGVVLLALASLLLPLYAIPENTFPPAPWAELPGHLAWKQDAAIVLYLAALVLAVAACAAAVASRFRFARAVLTAAVATGLGAAATGAWLALEWLGEAPATPLWSVLGLILPAAAGAVALAVAGLAWARARAPLID